jgi:predicted acetyltransferase
MKLTILPYEEEKHREEVARLWSVAFRAGDPYKTEENLVPHDAEAFVAYLGEELIGAYRVIDFSTTRDDARLKVSGIAAVAIKVEHRQKGMGSQLMQSALRILYERNVPLSALYAFKESYYRTFGFECAGTRYRIKCSPENLPRGNAPLPLNQISYQDFPLLQPAYESFAKRYSGMNLPRHPERWKALLSIRHKEPLVFTVGDPVEGYAVLRLTDNFWQDQPIAEVAWATPQAYQSLLSLFSAIAINRSAILWYEPGDSPFLASYRNRGVSAESVHPLMFRMVSLPHALRSLRPLGRGEFTLKVSDPLFPENEGPWRVVFDEKDIQVEKAKEANLKTDILSFVQGFLGEPSFSSLARNGRIQVHQDKDFQSLLLLCPPSYVYCLDVY